MSLARPDLDFDWLLERTGAGDDGALDELPNG
jgi:hypothetical protein